MIKEQNEMVANLVILESHIYLNISDSKDNEKLLTSFNALKIKRKNYGDKIEEFDGTIKELGNDTQIEKAQKSVKNSIDSFLSISRQYFKNEWDRAKRGE